MAGGSDARSTSAFEGGVDIEQINNTNVRAVSDWGLMHVLMGRLGGPHALIEQLSELLNESEETRGYCNPAVVDQDSPGYCYLRLFDPVEHRDAKQMGAYPTTAEVRRFTNRRAAPFGARNVQVVISAHRSERCAHVVFRGGSSGVRPVSALAALAKDCRVGGYPTEDKFGDLLSSVTLRRFLEVSGCPPVAPESAHSLWLAEAIGNAVVCVPNDLPFNIPDPDKYPYSRYSGLHVFVNSMSYSEGWEFMLDIGAKRDQTPSEDFWKQAFYTGTVLSAYFRLLVTNREKFTRVVTWIRDPLPGRPGGVQIVPPEWPGVIPTPLHHTMTRYAGIAEWVQHLPKPWPEVCRLALFGIHEPFDPIWWSDYHKTVDVYIMYTRLSPELRISFDQAVYWIPDGTPGPDFGSDADEDGHCYLQLFRAGSRPRVRARLGKNPWASALVASLLGCDGAWSSGRFRLTVLDKNDSAGTAFHQAHVEAADDGLSVSAIMGMLSGAMRVGATNDLNALADVGEEQVAVRPTIFPTLPTRGGQGMELSFNLYAVLGKDAAKYPAIAFNVLQEPVMAMMLGVYESVQLVSAKFLIDVPTGASNGIYAAVCSPTTSLVTDLDWLAAPINQVVYGSDQGHVHANFELPQVHPFERELRAGSFVGNPVPTFRFSFAGNAGAIGVVKGQLVVRCRGQYAMGHVRIGAPQTGKALRAEVDRIHDTMNYEEMGATRAPSLGADDDGSSEDDRPNRAGAPKTISSGVRTATKSG